MIEQTTIDGRKATVAYFDDEWNPRDRADATLVKIRFEDGEVAFGVPALPPAAKYSPDQPRDPAGTATGGQWSKEGGGAQPGDLDKPIDLFGNAPDIGDDMSRDSGAAQPLNDLDKLLDAAKADEQAFRAEVEAAAKTVGGDTIFPPGSAVKGRPRAEEKIANEYGGDATQLKDLLRATILGKDVEGTRQAAANFIATMGDRIVRVKDKIATTDNDYRDILINYRTPAGLIAEVQFNSPNMLKVKFGEGHRLYEAIRIMKANEIDEIRRLKARSIELYNHAYQLDGNGSWRKRR